MLALGQPRELSGCPCGRLLHASSGSALPKMLDLLDLSIVSKREPADGSSQLFRGFRGGGKDSPGRLGESRIDTVKHAKIHGLVG